MSIQNNYCSICKNSIVVLNNSEMVEFTFEDLNINDCALCFWVQFLMHEAVFVGLA
jgi:hypothetical protein